jgi:hypothetical protein
MVTEYALRTRFTVKPLITNQEVTHVDSYNYMHIISFRGFYLTHHCIPLFARRRSIIPSYSDIPPGSSFRPVFLARNTLPALGVEAAGEADSEAVAEAESMTVLQKKLIGQSSPSPPGHTRNAERVQQEDN